MGSGEQKPRQPIGLAGFSMVGVARIELATPAMSKQGMCEKARFSVPFCAPERRTTHEQNGNLRKFHRNFTGELCDPPPKRKAPDLAGTGSRARLGFLTEGKTFEGDSTIGRVRKPILSLRFAAGGAA